MNIPATINNNQTKRDHSIFEADIEGQAMNLQYLKRIAGWVKPHKQAAIASIVLVLFASVLAVLLPVLLSRVVVDEILMDAPNALLPDFGLLALTQWISDLGGISEVSAACCIYAIFILICHALYHLHRVKLARVVLFSLRDMRQDLFSHMELRPSSFYDRVAIGRVMTRVTNDVQALIELLMGLGALIGQFVPFFIALFVMFAINAELTLYLLGAIPLFVVVTYFFRQATRKVYRLIRNTVSQLNQNLQENLSGMQVVQLSNRENFNLNVYEGINNGNRKHEFHAVNLESTYGAFMDNMVNLALAVIIWVGGGAALQESVSLGSVILFTYFIDMFIQPIRVLGHQYNILFRAMASAERIFQALDWDENVDEPAKPVELSQRTAGQIEFKNLSFSYDDELRVLKDISLKIAAGEKLAVVGPTGSGKSTLIRLLGRFYNFQRGTIFLDGVDLLDLDSKDLRQRVGVVMQDFHIFSGSILDNITLGNPSISDDQGVEAARAVNAHSFIESLPEGYQTQLVERGQNLSQGQRQLLAFARVLAANPEILVLDEATASIDTETEEIIQNALKIIMKGRTSILIAHRLKTIQEAARILVLKNGRVKEIGTHDVSYTHLTLPTNREV